MAVHRYWRFLVNAGGRQGDVVSLMEIGASDTIGGANGLTGSTVTASTQLGGWAATQAIDGNLATGWATTTANVFGEWIKFDLGAGNEKDLSAELWITTRNDGFGNQIPISGSWQYSDDNINWTTALNYALRTSTGNGMTVYTPDLIGSYLDASAKGSTNVAVSGRNLIATFTGATGIRANRDIRGLVYFEGTITTLSGTPQIGLAHVQWDNSTALGNAVNSLGYQPGGQVRVNAVTLATIAAYAAGSRIGVAVDHSKKLIWFRVNGGNWNNSALNDPATGVGGIDFSSMTGGTLFPAFTASLTGTVWTTAFQTFVDAAPAGFTTLSAANFGDGQTGFSDLKTLEPIVPGEQIPTPITVLNRSLPPQQRVFSPAGPITIVSGLAEESGVPVEGKLIEVFDRISGDRLDWDLSEADGSWSCVCLGRPSVRVVGSDPTLFNSQVYDNVIPV